MSNEPTEGQRMACKMNTLARLRRLVEMVQRDEIRAGLVHFACITNQGLVDAEYSALCVQTMHDLGIVSEILSTQASRSQEETLREAVAQNEECAAEFVSGVANGIMHNARLSGTEETMRRFFNKPDDKHPDVRRDYGREAGDRPH